MQGGVGLAAQGTSSLRIIGNSLKIMVLNSSSKGWTLFGIMEEESYHKTLILVVSLINICMFSRKMDNKHPVTQIQECLLKLDWRQFGLVLNHISILPLRFEHSQAKQKFF